MPHRLISSIIPLPSTRQIQFLLALKQEGSFNRAAQFCGVTQSTLSAAIQEMETILGASLIDRANRKKLIFTALGEDMLERGVKIINSLTAVTEQAKRANDPLSTPLRVGIIPTIAPYLLPKILRPLQKAFPKLVLHINEMQTPALVDAVNKGDLDFGILAFPFDTSALQQLPLFKEKFFCAAPLNLFQGKQKVSLTDIELQKLLLLSDGHCLRDHALAACHMKSAQLPQDVSATSLSTLIQLVAQGYGITLLPEMVMKGENLPDNIKILPINGAPTREIGVVWRKNAALQNDILAIALSVYRLVHGKAIKDDSFNLKI